MSEVFFGLSSIVISVVVLANLNYGSNSLLVLLSIALLFNAARMMASGGIGRGFARLESLGLVGAGTLAAGILLVVIFFPGLSFQTLVFLFAIALSIQGIGRIWRSARGGSPTWLRGSALATGLLTVSLAVGAVAAPGIAPIALVPLLGAIVLVNGVEMVVWGLRPTDPRQLTLLKLVLFSAFYGLVLINWLDLYGTAAPAYHVWLVLTYMAPFGVLIVFQGLRDWQLAVSLGLLVSLMNDVGYYFVGDLLFGFHVALIPWLEGQLGFFGGRVLFTFQGGIFTIPVTSLLMGVSIYARAVLVALVLYLWWRQPSRIPKIG